MANSRRRRMREARRRRNKDLRHSPLGFLALGFALTALVLFVVAVVASFVHSGEGNYPVGAMGMIGLVLAVGAWILGRWTLKDAKIRPMPARYSVVIGMICSIVYIIFLILGMAG